MTENQSLVEISLTIDYRLTSLQVVGTAGDVLWQTAIEAAGCEMVWALMQHLRTEHDLLIGKLYAEHLILTHGQAVLPAVPTLTVLVRGKHSSTGATDAVEVMDVEISRSIASIIDSIVCMASDSLRLYDLTCPPPEERGQHYLGGYRLPQKFREPLENGQVVLKGILGPIKKLDQRLHDETGFRFVYEQEKQK